MADQTLEGTIRKTAGKTEMYDPTGQWREITPEQEKLQITPSLGGITEIGVAPAFPVDTGALMSRIAGTLNVAQLSANQIQSQITEMQKQKTTGNRAEERIRHLGKMAW